MDVPRQSLARFIKRECIYYPEKDYFLGKLPGARYKQQYYLANLLYNHDWLQSIVGEFANIVETEIGSWEFQLAGREWSAIPLLTAIPLVLRNRGIYLNSFMIKRKRKTYGRHNIIEGIPNKLPVLIVDDLCNSTDSFRHCRDVCVSEEHKLQVLPYIFAVVNKYFQERDGEAIGFDRYLGEDYKALSILTGDDIARC